MSLHGRSDVHDVSRWEEAYRAVRRNRLLRRLRIGYFRLPAGIRVLDYGCGDGLNLEILAEGRDALGMDISLDLVKRAPGRVVVGDGHRAPFPDACFAAVYCDSILHHLELEPALAEIRRLLAPGGSFCLVEPAPSLCRTLFNTLTRSPIRHLSSYLAARHVQNEEEVAIHASWFRALQGLPRRLEALGLRCTMHRKLVLGVAIKWTCP